MKNKLILIIIFMSLSRIADAQEISLFPGTFTYLYYEDSNKITKSEFESLLSSDAEANRYWKKSKDRQKLSVFTGGIGIGFALLGTFLSTDQKNRNLLQVGALLSFGTSIWSSHSARSLQRKAILGYNENLSISAIDIGTTPNGIGLVLHF